MASKILYQHKDYCYEHRIDNGKRSQTIALSGFGILPNGDYNAMKLHSKLAMRTI